MTGLGENHKAQLCSWIGCNSDFTPLYKATVQGLTATAFHRACDNKGPTITFCFNTSGYVFGGYTSQSWISDSEQTIYFYDKHAFLFRLQTPNGFHPKLYRVKPGQEHRAACCNRNCGPMFGNDFCPFQDVLDEFTGFRFVTRKTVKSIAHRGIRNERKGNLDLGNTYNMDGDDCHTFCGNDMTFSEVEVFAVRLEFSHVIHVIRHQYSVAYVKVNIRYCDKHSLEKDPSIKQSMCSAIEAYSPPPDSKVKAINLLLLGPIGAGKSSFFNSVTSTFQREITAVARSGSGERSLTRAYRRYRVNSKETGEPIKLRLCDTRGLEIEGGLDLIDIMAVVEGHVPDRFHFHPLVPINAKSNGYKANPSPDDKTHCVSLVIDSTSLDVLPQHYIHLIKSLQQRLNGEGIPQVVILTKPDKVCPEVDRDVSKIFTSESVRELVDRTSELFGLPRHCVFPVKNYEQEMEVEEAVDIPILLCLKHVLRYANDYIQDSFCSD